MQLLSLGAVLAAQAAPPFTPRFREFLQREEFRELAALILGLIIAAQVINILAQWIASKALVERDAATLGNAFKLWLFYWIFGFALAVALGIGLPIVAAMGESWRVLMVIGGAAVLSLAMGFFLPMKIYAIGFLRALGLILLSTIIGAAVVFGVQIAAVKAFGWEQRILALQKIGGATEQERQAFFVRLNGYNAPDEIDRLLDEALHPIGPRPSLAEREKAVLTLQQKLAARRQALSIAPPEAAAAFQRQLDRYVKFLDAVKAERLAAPPSGTP